MPQIQTARLSMWYERYEAKEEKGNAPIILIAGFSMQATLWPEELLDALTSAGYPVIIFDNRDVGLTERCRPLRAGNPFAIAGARLLGLRPEVPYTLDAMADDVAALLDALEVPKAHIVGMSMGGMIAQLVAIRHPSRVLSLCSWSSMSGALHELLVHPKVLPGVFRKPSPDVEQRIEDGLLFWQLLGTKTWPGEMDRMREKIRETAERTTDISGIPRQFSAILASPSRRKALAKVQVPTIVIHGTSDPMVPYRGGVATAAAIPNAELCTIPDYGHNLPVGLMATIASEIVDNASRV